MTDNTDTETLAEVRLTDTEHDAIITALLNPDDDCAHNLAPLFRAVRSILAARVERARAGEGALREAWDEGLRAGYTHAQSEEEADRPIALPPNPYRAALTTADPS